MYKYSNIKELLNNHPIIPVIVLNDEKRAITLAKTLLEAGITIMEITLRVPNAFKIIELISQQLPEMTVGAGTVINADQYHLAITHGAKFIVSPGLSKDLIDVSKNYNCPFLPGAITPSEIIQAIDSGFDHLKFFPSESFNGISTLKTYSNVFSNIKFCPTGGINLSNMANYLCLPNVAAIGCSFIADNNLINSDNFVEISETARKTLAVHADVRKIS